MIKCKTCGLIWKYLIPIRPSKCPKCNIKWSPDGLGKRKYDISSIIIGASIIIPWKNSNMMYTVDNSQVIKQRVREHAKKLGWQVECLRHVAGIKVTRLS